VRTYSLMDLFRDFPRLNKSPTPFKRVSPADIQYNCIAWTMGVNNQWWQPGKHWYWPSGCPQEITIPAFVRAFATLGYEPCSDGRREKDYEKVVLYAEKEQPTHAARQLKNGRWTSKLGKDIDIEHKVKDLEGPCYGRVAMYFRRPKQDV